MNLKSMRIRVRRNIDDVNSEHFVDSEINDALNEGLSILCADSMPLETTAQFTTAIRGAGTVPYQEYALWADVHSIRAVQYYDGFLFNLVPRERVLIQQGNQITGIPDSYYLRQISNVVAGQIANNPPAIFYVDTATPQSTILYRIVLGLFPVPNVAGKTVTVTYLQKAPTLVNDTDIAPIDPEYHVACIDYATSICKEKDQAFMEADRSMSKFEKAKEKYHSHLKYQGMAGFRKVKLHDEPIPRRKVNIFIGKVS